MIITTPMKATGIRAQGLPSDVRAPLFDLPATPDGKSLSLASLRGAPVVLVFYPADFTPVCTSELGIFNELLPELAAFDARVLGVSVDSLWTHVAFATELNLHYPLLADFHPKGDVARRYDVYREDEGTSERALFVIDRDGVIFWREVSPIETNPGADGVIDALERLTGVPSPLDLEAPL